MSDDYKQKYLKYKNKYIELNKKFVKTSFKLDRKLIKKNILKRDTQTITCLHIDILEKLYDMMFNALGSDKDIKGKNTKDKYINKILEQHKSDCGKNPNIMGLINSQEACKKLLESFGKIYMSANHTKEQWNTLYYSMYTAITLYIIQVLQKYYLEESDSKKKNLK
jgi:hypothetical protein